MYILQKSSQANLADGVARAGTYPLRLNLIASVLCEFVASKCLTKLLPAGREASGQLR